ncbi:hypothetical protein [Rhizobium sp. NLR10a]|uniref:hypothetical protein n=1 Tax=Rhizobium sp. NLR10a TaxID=2731105 RepID=UPI002180D5DC|nr:hypothetical protein [Rhizobium sp. NLR10a]
MVSNHGKERYVRSTGVFRKDETLDRLADDFNVAQFVSFAPSAAGPAQQYCRLAGLTPNYTFATLVRAIEALFERSAEGTVNVRSFSAEQAQSREFLYALKSTEEAVQAVQRMTAEGAFTIVNETIDVADGGVSGVAMGDIVEFRPDSTPRGVEKPGFAALPLDWAARLFQIVYGIDVSLEKARGGRLEFSLHPRRRGWKQTHVIFWEYGHQAGFARTVEPTWPNDFSRMVGDKVYGLMIAHLAGVPVPRTTIIGRRVAPFSFGTDTASAERWIRTSPIEQVPGKFTTAFGWQDPFLLVQNEDPTGKALASILSQQGVPARWSGAALETAEGDLVIEGVKGSGEAFMLGTSVPQRLPELVKEAVGSLRRHLRETLGAVRFEWVFDGEKAWIVQLHRGASVSHGNVIVPGDAEKWVTFHVPDGLEALRQLLASFEAHTGVTLDRPIGLTSHLADVIRKAGIPARVSE